MGGTRRKSRNVLMHRRLKTPEWAAPGRYDELKSYFKLKLFFNSIRRVYLERMVLRTKKTACQFLFLIVHLLGFVSFCKNKNKEHFVFGICFKAFASSNPPIIGIFKAR